MRCHLCKAKLSLFTRHCTLGCINDPRTLTTPAGLEARAQRLAHGTSCACCGKPATHRGYIAGAPYPLCADRAAAEGGSYDYIEEITAIVPAMDLSGIAYRGGAP